MFKIILATLDVIIGFIFLLTVMDIITVTPPIMFSILAGWCAGATIGRGFDKFMNN